MRTPKTNKAQLAFIAEHPEMMKDYQPPEKEKKDSCTCEAPEYTYEKPSLRTDGTYFNYCKRCNKFRDVPKPVTRELKF